MALPDLSPYEPLIQKYAKQKGLDPNEVRALIYTESNGNPNAQSHDKNGVIAEGLMQVNTRVHKGMKNPLDPEENIDRGTDILKDAYRTAARRGFKGNDLQRAAWATYNKGDKKIGEAIDAHQKPEDVTESGKYGNYPTTVQHYLDEMGAKAQAPKVEATTDHTQALGDTDDKGTDLETLPSGNVAFRNRTGEAIEVKPEDAADALYNRGLKPMPRDEYVAEQTDKALRAKYGSGLKNALASGAEGAINGLWSGAGDAALVKLGIEPAEAIKAHEKYFGTTRKGAEAATFLGSQFFGEGEAQDLARAGKVAEDANKAMEASKVAGALPEGKKAAGLLPAASQDVQEAAPVAETVSDGAQKQLEGKGPFQGLLPAKGETKLSDAEIQDFKDKFPQKVQKPRAPKQAKGWAPGVDRDLPEQVDPENILSSRPANMPEPPLNDLPTPAENAESLDKYPRPDPEKLRDAYEAISKSHGKDYADALMRQEETEGAREALDEATPRGDVTNAGGRGPQRSPAMRNLQPEFDLSRSEMPSDYVPPERAAQPLPERPAGIREPLPPEANANVPRPPEGQTGPSRFTVDPEGNVREQRVGGPGEAREPDEILPPEEQPAAQANPASHYIDPEGNAIPAPKPAAGAKASEQTIEPEFEVGDPRQAPAAAAVPGAAPAPTAPPAPPATLADYAQGVASLATKPNRAVFGLGQQLGKAVEQGVGEGTMLGRLAGHIASGAIQSVPYTVGSNLSEATLNNDKLTMERLFAGGMGNAMLAGGLGGAFGLAAEGLGKLNMKFKNLVDQTPALERLQNMKNSFDSVRAGTEQFSKAVYQQGLKYQRVADLLGDTDTVVKGGSHVWQTLDDVTGSFMESIRGEKGVVADKARNAWADYVVASRQASKDAELFQAADTFKRTIANLYHEELSINPGNKDFAMRLKSVKRAWMMGLEDQGTWGKAGEFQGKLNDAWENLIEKNTKKSPIFATFMRKGMIDAEGDMVFDEGKLQHYLKQLGSEHPDHQAAAELKSQIMKEWLDAHREYIGTLKEHIYDPLRKGQEIENFHNSLGADDGRIAKTIADMQDLSESQKKTMWRRLLSSHSMRYGAAMGLMSAGVPHAFMMTWGVSTVLNHLLGQGFGASGFARALTEHGERFTSVMDEAMDQAFKGAGKAGAGSVGVFRELRLTPSEVMSKDRQAQAAEVANHVAQQAADPSFPQRLQAATGMLNITHPEMAVGMQAKAMQIAQILHDEAPKDPLPPDVFNKVPFKPGHAATAAFEQVAEVLANPLVLIRDFANGSITTKQVQIAEQAFPEIVSAMRQMAQEKLPKYAKDMTYQQRLAFGRLMGAQMDWSTNPDSVQKLQQIHNLPKPGQGDPSKGGAANQKKPSKPTSAKQETMLSDNAQLGLQSALSRV